MSDSRSCSMIGSSPPMSARNVKCSRKVSNELGRGYRAAVRRSVTTGE